MEWRVPHSYKNRDSLADVATSVVDQCYSDMKTTFDERYHAYWASWPLSWINIDYAAKDAYACYEIWQRCVNIRKGFA